MKPYPLTTYLFVYPTTQRIKDSNIGALKQRLSGRPAASWNALAMTAENNNAWQRAISTQPFCKRSV